MKLFSVFLQIKRHTKRAVISEEQRKVIEVGREQFQKLVKQNLGVPVAFL